MTPAFKKLQGVLKKLPGLGYRSSERIALHLTVEQPKLLPELVTILELAAERIRRCQKCGNLCEEEECLVCSNPKRIPNLICVVEHVPDLIAIENSGEYRGLYHVLHGKLSPINGIGPDDINIRSLEKRLRENEVVEVILALSNDIEGEATCHYMQESFLDECGVKVTRIGFGIPSGGGIVYADSVTLKSALEGRREYL
ncbi:MAG: Recombination protein RecR [Candidatus Moanabacter tarae]|uniref:Recombination protein RecR n=1 Tax=Candidatus Moanibacter tarae TaxID=2200854 RepID=A0A2Z4AGX3_9BACT|nr:MAG: Recombination protein RecR [Candidatus Moanabacter tarae]